jgi:hypothetical protein
VQYPPYPPPQQQPPPHWQSPYQPPPPPPKQGLSGTTIALIVVGVVVVLGLFVVVPLGMGVYVGYTRAKERAAAAKVSPHAVALSASYTTPNGLLTAHYPADFAAKSLDDATLVVSRNFPGGEDEVVTLAAVRSPITNDPHELARILLGLVDKNVAAKKGTSTKTAEREVMCLGKYRGVETEGTFSLPGSATYESKACFFLHGDRGYEVRYDVPRSRAADEVPLLTRIIEATVLAP